MSGLILYTTEDGQNRIQLRADGQTAAALAAYAADEAELAVLESKIKGTLKP